MAPADSACSFDGGLEPPSRLKCSVKTAALLSVDGATSPGA